MSGTLFYTKGLEVYENTGCITGAPKQRNARRFFYSFAAAALKKCLLTEAAAE